MSAHIIVYAYTPELERVARFYEQGLGVAPGSRQGYRIPFSVGGATFALHGLEGHPGADTTGFHLGFRVDDIDAVVQRFVEHRGRVLRDVADEAYGKSAGLRDSEGRSFGLVAIDLR